MRLIDADETLNKLAEWQAAAYAEGDVFHHGVSQGLFDAITIITQAPTIDPVKHGRWEEYQEIRQGLRACGGENAVSVEYEVELLMCSECDEIVEYASNFCPNCGAKMDGDNK